MNDTPTPRTDALMPTQENGRTLYDYVQVMEIHARQLERELAEVTKQRDALAEAINDMTQLPSSEAYKRGKQALAAVKGGQHE
jgi:hypothetical protein